MMVLTDIYCRVNRARGLELLSPEDLLNACRQLAPMNLPIILRSFDSGVMVLQSQAHSDYEITEAVAQLVYNYLLFNNNNYSVYFFKFILSTAD
jgi:ESCRT-II complex subunit VPS36